MCYNKLLNLVNLHPSITEWTSIPRSTKLWTIINLLELRWLTPQERLLRELSQGMYIIRPKMCPLF